MGKERRGRLSTFLPFVFFLVETSQAVISRAIKQHEMSIKANYGVLIIPLQYVIGTKIIPYTFLFVCLCRDLDICSSKPRDHRGKLVTLSSSHEGLVLVTRLFGLFRFLHGSRWLLCFCSSSFSQECNSYSVVLFYARTCALLRATHKSCFSFFTRRGRQPKKKKLLDAVIPPSMQRVVPSALVYY